MARAPANESTAFWLATLAVVFAAGFTVAAVFAPANSDGATLLEENRELPVQVAIAIPPVVASGVWLLLHVACRFDARCAKRAGVTGFSIGLLVAPAAIALVIAASLTPVSRAE